MAALGPSLSQTDPALHPGDIDDCWCVATLQAARAVGGDIAGVDIPKVRKAAGRPDSPNRPNPGGAGDIIKAATVLWPTLRVKQSSTSWLTTRAAMVKQGKVAVLLVSSAGLAKDHRYGFTGMHAITGRFAATVNSGRFYGVNPLQPKGTRPEVYTDEELERATLAYPGGVQAVLFAPAEPVPLPDPDLTPYSQADLDDATEQGRVAGIQAGIDALESLL